jgi:hypothetical protein
MWRPPSARRRLPHRGLITGLTAGALALVALIVVQHDDARIRHGLTSGLGPLVLTSSAAAGAVTLVLVRGRRYGAARIPAAGAVAAVVAGRGSRRARICCPDRQSTRPRPATPRLRRSSRPSRVAR